MLRDESGERRARARAMLFPWYWLSRRTRRTLATGILPRDRQPAACCWHTMTALKQQEQ